MKTRLLFLKSRFVVFLCILIVGSFRSVEGQVGSVDEPVNFIGKLNVNFSRPDGGLPPVIGAHNYQVLRSVREDKDLGDGLGFTFHHHPMLTFWKNKFFVLCNACPVHEERDLTEILLIKSDDGINWGKTEIIFPHVIYKNEPTFCNHRMGFYIAPSGRLYASTAYFPQSEMKPQSGSEDTAKKYFGVVMREIKEDGSFGPIFFIAQNNSLYQPDDFPFPYFTSSIDETLISDFESLRSDKLITLHWWEQIRPEDFDFPETLEKQIKNGNRKFAKAISYYHREDGAVVALWKNSKSALSFDEGNSWSEVANLKTFSDGYAKVWGQSTEDGKYAASWRPIGEGSWGRYPMLWAVSNDGIVFDQAMHVNGEVTMRYEGGSKNIGPCNYQRGLYENNAEIPGDDVWVVYSMSKEDIWISRIPVPITSETDAYVNENFEDLLPDDRVSDWNIYHPKWAPVKVFADGVNNNVLSFGDADPYDYAKAFKVFKESENHLKVKFKIKAGQNNHGRFEVELGNSKSLQPVKMLFNSKGEIEVEHWHGSYSIGHYLPNQWINVELDIDVKENRFTIVVDNQKIENLIFNSRKVKSLNRITFRTGLNRGISINPVDPKTDLPLEKTAMFYLDDLSVDVK